MQCPQGDPQITELMNSSNWWFRQIPNNVRCMSNNQRLKRCLMRMVIALRILMKFRIFRCASPAIGLRPRDKIWHAQVFQLLEHLFVYFDLHTAHTLINSHARTQHTRLHTCTQRESGPLLQLHARWINPTDSKCFLFLLIFVFGIFVGFVVSGLSFDCLSPDSNPVSFIVYLIPGKM